MCIYIDGRLLRLSLLKTLTINVIISRDVNKLDVMTAVMSARQNSVDLRQSLSTHLTSRIIHHRLSHSDESQEAHVK